MDSTPTASDGSEEKARLDRIERERAQARERVRRYKARKKQKNYKEITVSIPAEYEAEIRSCVAAAITFLQRQKKSD